MSLSAHLTASTADHGRLAFHPDCPRCQAERLAGSLATDSLVSRRTQAALAAGLLAFTGAAPAAAAQVPEVDEQQDAAPAPGGGPPGLQPDFDPGGADTFDHETAPLPGGPEAGGQEDQGLGPPVETEPTTDPDAELLLEEEHAPAPVPPAPEPVAAPTPTAPPVAAPPPAPATAVPPPPEPPAAELEQPARQPEQRQTRRARKTHEVERRPVTGTSPTPPPESPAPVAQAVASPAAPTTAPVSEPSTVTTAPVSQPGEPARQPISGQTYTVRAGDSLWSIARRLLGAGASNGQIAREVNRLWQLNQERIGTGDPSLLHIGTELRLP